VNAGEAPAERSRSERVDVAVVGAGPAGLAAATALAPLAGRVVVLERESEPGGVPRHCAHTGFGLRDLHRVLSGPGYARRLVRRAEAAGAQLRMSSTVTGWEGPLDLAVTGPRGRSVISARAIVLATGARERPRAARWIAGDRPEGVFTTGSLQRVVHLHHHGVGRRAVVVGAEPVSWSAVLTLRKAGCVTALMVSGHDRPESPWPVTQAGRIGLRVPVARQSRVVRILGHRRVEAVELEHLPSGRRRIVPCDVVVLTGDWIAEHELARLGGLAVDVAGSGVVVDSELRTDRPGVFAAGNLVHPVDTADGCALDGRHVARAVLDRLAGAQDPADGVGLVVGPPLRWVSPSRLRPGDELPARNRLLLWGSQHVSRPLVVVEQDGRRLAEWGTPWPLSPGRVFRVPADLVADVDRRGGPVRISLGR